MSKFFNWLLGKPKQETEEEKAKRIAEINEAYDDLQNTNAELKRVEKELAELNKVLRQYGEQ